MTRIKFTITAAPDSRYGPSSFEGSIGHDIPVSLGNTTTTGKVIAATVADDGTHVEFDVDVPGLSAEYRPTELLTVTYSKDDAKQPTKIFRRTQVDGK